MIQYSMHIGRLCKIMLAVILVFRCALSCGVLMNVNVHLEKIDIGLQRKP